jgi:hypothetical protein
MRRLCNEYLDIGQPFANQCAMALMKVKKLVCLSYLLLPESVQSFLIPGGCST